MQNESYYRLLDAFFVFYVICLESSDLPFNKFQAFFLRSDWLLSRLCSQNANHVKVVIWWIHVYYLENFSHDGKDYSKWVASLTRAIFYGAKKCKSTENAAFFHFQSCWSIGVTVKFEEADYVSSIFFGGSYDACEGFLYEDDI